MRSKKSKLARMLFKDATLKRIICSKIGQNEAEINYKGNKITIKRL